MRDLGLKPIRTTPHFRSPRRHKAAWPMLALVVVSLFLCLCAVAVGGSKLSLQRSASTVHVTATVERVTESCGKTCSYDSHVSFTMHGRLYTDIDIDGDQDRQVGDAVAILVNPSDPTDNTLADDHGGLDFLAAGALLAGAVVLLVLWRRQRRINRGPRAWGT